MRKISRPFLIPDNPAREVLRKWETAGICCTLDATGTGITLVNCTWPTPGDDDKPSPSVPDDAIEELGQWYDEILAHLRYWHETRALWERIMQNFAKNDVP